MRGVQNQSKGTRKWAFTWQWKVATAVVAASVAIVHFKLFQMEWGMSKQSQTQAVANASSPPVTSAATPPTQALVVQVPPIIRKAPATLPIHRITPSVVVNKPLSPTSIPATVYSRPVFATTENTDPKKVILTKVHMDHTHVVFTLQNISRVPIVDVKVSIWGGRLSTAIHTFDVPQLGERTTMEGDIDIGSDAAFVTAVRLTIDAARFGDSP